MAKITFALDDGQQVIVPLTDRLSLGRDEDNDVVVNDDRLAPLHAEILPHASGSYEVRDLGSSTGTFVNDQRVQSCRLLPGDRLTFGPLSAVLELEESAAPLAEFTRLHDEKSAVLQQLSASLISAEEQHAAHAVRHEKERAQAEARLGALQQQIAELDQRLQDGHSRLAIQKEEIGAAEHTLTRLEQRRSQLKTSLQALTDTEEKLTQAQARLQEAEARHAALTTSTDLLAKEQQQRGKSLALLQADLHRSEAELTARRHELAAESHLLEEAQRRRTELEEQCQALVVQQRAESAPQPSKPAPAAPPPANAAPAPSPIQSAPLGTPRIVAIDSPRFTVIPMKSERVVRRAADAPPSKAR